MLYDAHIPLPSRKFRLGPKKGPTIRLQKILVIRHPTEKNSKPLSRPEAGYAKLALTTPAPHLRCAQPHDKQNWPPLYFCSFSDDGHRYTPGAAWQIGFWNDHGLLGFPCRSNVRRLPLAWQPLSVPSVPWIPDSRRATTACGCKLGSLKSLALTVLEKNLYGCKLLLQNPTKLSHQVEIERKLNHQRYLEM